MGNYYKTTGSYYKTTGSSKVSNCVKPSCKVYNSKKPYGYDNCDECKCLENEMKEMLENLMQLEEYSNKKLDKAREYQEQVEILLGKAMEAHCKASELLAEVDCLEQDATDLREKVHQLIYKTIDCYRNECCNNCCCNCNCCNKDY